MYFIVIILYGFTDIVIDETGYSDDEDWGMEDIPVDDNGDSFVKKDHASPSVW